MALVCGSKSSDDMCRQLYITHATLSKHLSNIYAKTKVRNRTQLFGLFTTYRPVSGAVFGPNL